MTSQTLQWYDQLKTETKHERKSSKIFNLRTLNNHVKNFGISLTCPNKLDQSSTTPTTVPAVYTILDMGCGRGGDLIKFYNHWTSHFKTHKTSTEKESKMLENSKVFHYIGLDSSSTSIKLAQERYGASRIPKNDSSIEIEFHVYDFNSDDDKFSKLQALLGNKFPTGFSCINLQYCLHYCNHVEKLLTHLTTRSMLSQHGLVFISMLDWDYINQQNRQSLQGRQSFYGQNGKIFENSILVLESTSNSKQCHVKLYDRVDMTENIVKMSSLDWHNGPLKSLKLISTRNSHHLKTETQALYNKLSDAERQVYELYNLWILKRRQG